MSRFGLNSANTKSNIPTQYEYVIHPSHGMTMIASDMR